MINVFVAIRLFHARRGRRSGVVLAALLAAGLAHAAKPEDALDRFLQETRSMTATFVQVSIDESGRPGKRSIGKFFLARPGKFRWNYETPYKQEIVANGKKVWFYDEDLEQVTVKQLGAAIGSTPALLLTGQVGLEQNFTREDLGSRDGIEWVRLVPKDEDNSFRYISIGMKDNHLEGMELSDNFGQLTRISFAGVQRNTPIDPAVFEFEAPPGVDVFEDG